ncbi:cell division topological specificity factor MinE [Desulfosporosinus meridiei]|uniref:Cell division topological specificity factor n=1 Tax=Desulfosporosinus meridiei (strain ATCC BAA-275 / DSM 13257 / KCTC 12902 / NCIMB 13706 / S10) TaxID=768704 RepID=J7J0X3_DESMD|nr:cell division topological specificity factor MinE [Desulfosporosinus meridiei]AFQ46014.1 cell division topological specificity factor MinE [Desulfosporosinus meridiei DSM 13257]
MLEFISRMLGRESASSKSVAKERLRLVLVHDRASISPAMLNKLREDLVKVISNYMEIDEAALEFNLCQDDREVALIANIPVVKMKRDYSAKGQELNS